MKHGMITLLLVALGALNCSADNETTNALAVNVGTTATNAVTNQLVITTRDGRKYERCKIQRVEPDGLYIFHSNGIAKIDFHELPDDVRRKYGYNPTEADTYSKQQTEIRRAAEYRRAQEQAAARRIQEEEARKRLVTESRRIEPRYRSYESDADRFQRLAEQKAKELEPLYEQKAKELEPYYQRAASQIDWRPGMSEAEMMRQIERAAESVQPHIERKAEEMQPEIERKSKELMREMGWE